MHHKAALSDHAGAQWKLVVIYQGGLLGHEADEENALFWYKKAATGGDEDTQCELGLGVDEELSLF